MNAQEILDSPDFKRCAEFHGHICPGLSIGYRATKLAMHTHIPMLVLQQPAS